MSLLCEEMFNYELLNRLNRYRWNEIRLFKFNSIDYDGNFSSFFYGKKKNWYMMMMMIFQLTIHQVVMVVIETQNQCMVTYLKKKWKNNFNRIQISEFLVFFPKKNKRFFSALFKYQNYKLQWMIMTIDRMYLLLSIYRIFKTITSTRFWDIGCNGHLKCICM